MVPTPAALEQLSFRKSFGFTSAVFQLHCDCGSELDQFGFGSLVGFPPGSQPLRLNETAASSDCILGETLLSVPVSAGYRYSIKRTYSVVGGICSGGADSPHSCWVYLSRGYQPYLCEIRVVPSAKVIIFQTFVCLRHLLCQTRIQRLDTHLMGHPFPLWA